MNSFLKKYVRHGRATLKGGQVSDFYIDIKAALGDPRVLMRFTRDIASRVDARATCIAGSGYGGLPLATTVSQKLKLPLVMVRERVKTHGTQEWIDGYVPGRDDRVVIVDDVFTSGTSITQTERILRITGARIIGRYVVVDRSRRKKSTVVSLFAIHDAPRNT